MRARRPAFSTANLLAHLEATASGLVDVNEEERRKAQAMAEQVTEAESRKWRAHRRPSKGRSRPMRRTSLLLVLALGLFGQAQEPGEEALGQNQRPGRPAAGRDLWALGLTLLRPAEGDGPDPGTGTRE